MLTPQRHLRCGPVGSPTADERIEATIDTARRDGERIVAIAAREAHRIVAVAEAAGRALAAARIEQLRDLGREIEARQRLIDDGYATMIEAMAATSNRLVEATRDADFSSPPGPAARGRTVEVKMAQTREITFRFDPAGDPAGGLSHAV